MLPSSPLFLELQLSWAMSSPLGLWARRQPRGEPGDARAVLPPAAFKQGRGTAVAETKQEEIPLFATISGSA